MYAFHLVYELNIHKICSYLWSSVEKPILSLSNIDLSSMCSIDVFVSLWSGIFTESLLKKKTMNDLAQIIFIYFYL